MLFFEPLDSIIQGYLPQDKIELVKRAFVIAKDGHEGQFRSSGEPYITHPVAVACIIANMRLDHEAVMAALLHDVIEDTPYTQEQLTAEFGKSVSDIVEGVSKLDKLKFRTRQEAQAESFRKMILAMTKDIRVVLIKLADRTHNMRTLGSLRPDKRRRIANETLEIYSPLAHRLGIEHVKNELEDLCFQAIHPQRYAVLNRVIEDARQKGQDLIQPILENLNKSLETAGIPARVYGREKPLFYIYQALKAHIQKFRTILDIYNFRVVTHNVDDCYRALGCIHRLYKPRAGQIKDYIAVPKTNGYQALHTATIGPKGIPVAVQIRTEEMDKMAKMGVAAHWIYKPDGKNDSTTAQIKAQRWLENIIELQQSAGNSFEFIESVKSDLFSREIYVFTPKGRIIELPQGATALDFAYAVHTDVGDSCKGAIVDRKDYPLSEPLVSGQTIDIVTSSTAKPSANWLNYVVTGRAKSKIRQALKIQAEQTALSEVAVPKRDYHCASCCHPILGDKIKAYETEEHQWLAHHEKCQNLKRHPESVDVDFEQDGREFEVELRVEINNSAALGNLMATLTAVQSNIHQVWSEDVDEQSLVMLLITTKDTEHLSAIIHKIQLLPEVISVQRNIND